jgi:hypothetical protein
MLRTDFALTFCSDPLRALGVKATIQRFEITSITSIESTPRSERASDDDSS